MDNFTDLAIELNPLLASEGIELHFEGYVETWQRYLVCDESMLDEVYVTMKETLAWADYFSEVLGWITWRSLTEENRTCYFKAHHEQTPVTDREFKKIQQHFEQSDFINKKLKIFVEHLKTQIKAFYKAYFQLREIYLKHALKVDLSLGTNF